MLVDHYHIIMFGSEAPCQLCVKDQVYKEDLPCVIPLAGKTIQVIPVIKV